MFAGNKAKMVKATSQLARRWDCPFADRSTRQTTVCIDMRSSIANLGQLASGGNEHVQY
jgi:hypothetical protein